MSARQLSRFAVLGLFTLTLGVGCGAQGTTQDSAPTAPPLTAENAKARSAEINAQMGALNKNKPK